jgi:hypothetical protein
MWRITNDHMSNPKKMTCKICWSPLKITSTVAKMTCMCCDEVRIIPLDRLDDMVYSHHIVETETESSEKEIRKKVMTA